MRPGGDSRLGDGCGALRLSGVEVKWGSRLHKEGGELGWVCLQGGVDGATNQNSLNNSSKFILQLKSIKHALLNMCGYLETFIRSNSCLVMICSTGGTYNRALMVIKLLFSKNYVRVAHQNI